MHHTLTPFAALAVLGCAGLPAVAQDNARSPYYGSATVHRGTTTGLAAAPLGGTIPSSRISAFRSYVSDARLPPFSLDNSVAVGTVLPEAGITLYDVPQEFASTTFRYTVVNEHTILVDPATRRVVQMID